MSSINSKFCTNAQPNQGMCDKSDSTLLPDVTPASVEFKTVPTKALAADDHTIELAGPEKVSEREDSNQHVAISNNDEGSNDTIPGMAETDPGASMNKKANGRVRAPAILGLNGRPLKARTMKKLKLRMVQEAESRIAIGDRSMGSLQAKNSEIAGTDREKSSVKLSSNAFKRLKRRQAQGEEH
ncbi:uncharacterized protein EAE97_005558 [Botrytis byssoidea]|uniref:Uncharacterized protein n=1 Tax=Botrytis byssoidea TaxID=139641 RepID=A0A9P5M3C4_9HELO|nr:uncharacterized protein EAE97_005558 [Botrytis byssoidea]KAF7944925.1 hypothetical protein EAE97_005558 [Botrytis byssoidea]